MDARPDDDADADATTGAQHPSGPAARPDGGVGVPPPPPPSATDDEVWASIVARLGDVDGGTDQAVRRALSDAHGGTPGDDGAAPGPASASEGAALSGRDWDGTTQYDAAEDDVDELEHFVPEDPGPVMGNDPLVALAWGAVAGVPLFLLVVVTLWRDAPTLLVRASVVVFVVALGVLVWRMPQHREPSDGDGAVV